MNKILNALLLLSSLFSVQACAQKNLPDYFELDFSGHKFENVTSIKNFDEHALRQGLHDNVPRNWYKNATTQFLIVKTGSNDTVTMIVNIDFGDSRADVPPLQLRKGSFALGENILSLNSDSSCPFPEGTVGPFIEIYTTSNRGTDSKTYKSGSYNFHKDTGNIVIDEMTTDNSGSGYIAGHFEGTLSCETTTIDTHADEHAICNKENYKYETLPLKGKFRLKLKGVSN
jgi:hypothetical protein